MRIVGGGLIARSLEPFASGHHSTVAFASGVASSSCEDEREYRRELDLLEEVVDAALRRGERIVYFSGGGAIYGEGDAPASEDDTLRPTSAYGRHQVACERLLVERRVPHVILRLPNVVGPTRNRTQLVPSIVAQVVAGRVTVQARAERDLIAADDFARVTSAILERIDSDAVINLASGVSVPVESIVSIIMRELGTSASIEHVAGGTRQRFSIDRLIDVLGRDPFPRPYPLDAILARFVPQLARTLGDERA